jgi:hypothetical protein
MATVTSRELYSLLRERIAPGLKQLGYKRLTGAMLGWTRPFGTEHLAFWFQCDRYGYMQDFGSSFTIEFQVSADTKFASGDLLRRERFHTLLSPEDLELVRELNNSVLSSLPEPGPSNPLHHVAPQLRESFVQAYLPEPTPYDRARDIWLHYFSAGDVRSWAEFLAPRIPGMVERYASMNHGSA